MTELALGARIGPYTLVRRIGEGGMGVVYECARDGSAQAIALKLLRPELAQNDGYRRRFEHEVRAASEVGHPGLVPIVEPEVVMDGDHSLEECRRVTTAVLRSVFTELGLMEVRLDGIVLKPNMVVAGDGCSSQPSPSEVAEATVDTLRETVPPAVPGIAFLSGGQDPEEATRNLAAMQEISPLPWELTYSFGRALVGPALETWQGSDDGWEAAQKALSERAVANASVR